MSKDAFRFLEKLRRFDVDKDNPVLCTINGMLCSRNGNTVLRCSPTFDRVVLPADVQCIGDMAFAECSRLRELRLGSMLREIGYASFHRCNGLMSLEIPEGVTNICDWAFLENENLRTVQLPFAFAGCKRLNEVVFPKEMKGVREGVFYDCPALKRICFQGTRMDTKGWFNDENKTNVVIEVKGGGVFMR